jgi:hypothetical protein
MTAVTTVAAVGIDSTVTIPNLSLGLIVSGVAFTSGRRAAEAALLRRQETVLQGYIRDLVAADNTKTIISITSKALAASKFLSS